MILRTSVILTGIWAIFLLLEQSHAFLRQERRVRDEPTILKQHGASHAILPVGRETIIKKDVVEQLRILRSKSDSDSGSSTKSTKGAKKKKKEKASKSMKQKQVKSSKGVKSAKGALSLPDTSVDDSDSTEDTTESDDTDQATGEVDSDDTGSASDEDDTAPASDEDDTDPASGEVDSEDTDPVSGGSEFNISDCDSYSNDWLLELADYCGPDLEDLSGCECPTAGQLLADGTLTCATVGEIGSSPPACPEGCAVCEFCMVLEGCDDIYD